MIDLRFIIRRLSATGTNKCGQL